MSNLLVTFLVLLLIKATNPAVDPSPLFMNLLFVSFMIDGIRIGAWLSRKGSDK